MNQWIFHISQMASIFLAFAWFNWKVGIVVFFINWAINTRKYVD